MARLPLTILGSVLFVAGCAGEEAPGPGGPGGPPPIVDANGVVPNYACPGSPGCEKAEGPLLVGVAARPITPVLETWDDLDGDGVRGDGEPFDDVNGNGEWDGVWLAGFAAGRAATEIHDDVWSRVLTFEQGDVSVAMVGLDLVGYFQQDVVKVRLEAAARGLDFDHVVVTSTHTHEGPDTMGMWGAEFGTTGYQEEYIQHIVTQTVDALAEAKASQKAARMKVARGEAPELVNDTRLPEVIDQSIHAAQFIDEAGAPFATLAVWGNHPEALGSDNTQLTSDYVHYLREGLEERYPGTTTVFLSGPLGGLMTTIRITGCPDAAGVETCPQGTFERAEYVGKGAADAAIAALEGSGATIEDSPSLAFRRRSFFIQPTNTGLALLVLTGVLHRDVYSRDKKLIPREQQALLSLTNVKEGDVLIGTELNGVHVGPLAIAMVPGEIYPELWMLKPDGSSYIERPEGGDFSDAMPETPIQAVLPAGVTPVIVNNANDALGYILPQTQFDDAPPYAYGEETEPQYGEENSVGYTMGPTLTKEFAAMYGR
ncbi:hypothetical protein [Chondromyces apiculatus]|uniref:Neutral/alkaline non-lysosomal ceramidase N-terminal domain-containing protein n=1 Tax=Chondromyces apiculatus DSM 436 TaxID=1192034 RepID=A0A017T7E4_9BACT|nr:hypothetical protein [Chondromyces apiculatus]EYF04725.1 Hypothetical protein CAP_4201 [Chondromyces apiculatus DSM 436]